MLTSGGSDQRLKENIINMESSTQKIMQLRPVSFDFKKDIGIDLPDGKRLGLIAQEVQTVFPEIISTVHVNDKKYNPETKKFEPVKVALPSYLNVDYTSLIPVLIKVIQEQQEQIQKLEERVKKLE